LVMTTGFAQETLTKALLLAIEPNGLLTTA
jgi:hypothetical protein